MKVHVAPKSGGETPAASTARTILALDLTGRPEHRALWRSRHAAASGLGSAAGLPNGGHASPMGFWLATATEASAAPPEARRIVVRPPGHALDPHGEPSRTPSRPARRPTQTIRVKALNPADGDLQLTISPDAAQVVASEATWNALAEPVLLGICQYWRFCALDEEIDRLTEQAYADIGPATMPRLATLRTRQRLTASAEAMRALMVDLPHFEGPLTDALPYCTSERSAQTYQALAEKLHLEAWCEAIDERAEAVEDAYEAVSEKLFEYRNFVWEAVLETLIILILLAELAVTIWEAFAP
jgi:hypothetical protein